MLFVLEFGIFLFGIWFPWCQIDILKIWCRICIV